jgi:hypothetical protein
VGVPVTENDIKPFITPVPTLGFGPRVTVGVAFTVTIAVTVLPEAVYEMTAVPAAMPFTVPLNDPTVAMPVLALFHVPPVVASVSTVTAPTQTVLVPVIGPVWAKTGNDKRMKTNATATLRTS